MRAKLRKLKGFSVHLRLNLNKMNGIYILLTIFCYFALLMLVAKLTSQRADNDAFSVETGNRLGM